MNKNITIGIIVLVVLAGAILIFSGGSSDTITPGTNEEGTATVAYDTVPSFTLQDYNGNEVSPSDFEGKVLILNSWATWCPFCVDELPDFSKLQEEFPETLVVVAIDRSESLSQAKQYTDNLGVTENFIFLLDPDDLFYQSIGGFSMPETLFVDGEGNIRIHKRGPMRLEEMREKVNLILEQSD